MRLYKFLAVSFHLAMFACGIATFIYMAEPHPKLPYYVCFLIGSGTIANLTLAYKYMFDE